MPRTDLEELLASMVREELDKQEKIPETVHAMNVLRQESRSRPVFVSEGLKVCICGHIRRRHGMSKEEQRLQRGTKYKFTQAIRDEIHSHPERYDQDAIDQSKLYCKQCKCKEFTTLEEIVKEAISEGENKNI